MRRKDFNKRTDSSQVAAMSEFNGTIAFCCDDREEGLYMDDLGLQWHYHLPFHALYQSILLIPCFLNIYSYIPFDFDIKENHRIFLFEISGIIGTIARARKEARAKIVPTTCMLYILEKKLESILFPYSILQLSDCSITEGAFAVLTGWIFLCMC